MQAVRDFLLPKPPRLSDLTRPIIQPHRGAGTLIAPEDTDEAFEIGAALGFTFLDGGDWRSSLDGGLVNSHDVNYDRVTTSSGNASDRSVIAGVLATVDASSWFSSNWPNVSNLRFAQHLSKYMTRFCTAPEPKDATAATLLAAAVARYGLQKSVLINAFDRTWLTPFTAIGCTEVLYNLTSLPSAPQRAADLAAGINWYAFAHNGTITPADATTLHNEGFKIMLGPVARGYDASSPNDWLSVQSIIDIWCADDPMYFSHVLSPGSLVTKYRKTTDPFESGYYYHGHHTGPPGAVPQASSVNRGTFVGGDRWALTAGVDKWTLQGWACPLASPTSWVMNFNVTFDAMVAGNNSRWAGIFFGCPNDAGYRDNVADTTTENGYQLAFRGTGSMESLKKTAAVVGSALTTATAAISVPLTTTSTLASGVAITSIPVSATPAAIASGARFKLPTGQVVTLSAGASLGATSLTVTSVTPSAAVPSGTSLPQTVPLRITRTGTQVTYLRVDTSHTHTLTDNTFFGPYFYFGQNATGGGAAAGFQVSFSDVVIT